MEKKRVKKIIQDNKKARFDYYIEEVIEAGIVLEGWEISSIRNGGLNLKDSYCRIKDNEVILIGAHISEYKFSTITNVDTRRIRKLLLHRRQINKLRSKIESKGYTLIPLNAHYSGHLVKIDIGISKGKHTHDKRRVLMEKQQNRYIEREIKNLR